MFADGFQTIDGVSSRTRLMSERWKKRNPQHSTHLCWICGKDVPLEKAKTDEHGKAVHEWCHIVKMALRHASSARDTHLTAEKEPSFVTAVAGEPVRSGSLRACGKSSGTVYYATKRNEVELHGAERIVQSEILSGWKEIATYLAKGVRTVQRYERELGLPVRHPFGKPYSSVLARRSELDVWVGACTFRHPAGP
jgi:hypothetical protein